MLQSAIGARLAKTGKSRVGGFAGAGLPKFASDKEVLDADGKSANPLACRVVDGVGHRGVCAGISEFA
jgi:hypothetical protein